LVSRIPRFFARRSLCVAFLCSRSKQRLVSLQRLAHVDDPSDRRHPPRNDQLSAPVVVPTAKNCPKNPEIGRGMISFWTPICLRFWPIRASVARTRAEMVRNAPHGSAAPDRHENPEIGREMISFLASIFRRFFLQIVNFFCAFQMFWVPSADGPAPQNLIISRLVSRVSLTARRRLGGRMLNPFRPGACQTRANRRRLSIGGFRD
jgi:hypothetical protein